MGGALLLAMGFCLVSGCGKPPEVDPSTAGGATRPEAAPTGPQTFYVDATRGDDAQPGNSAERPWKSLAKVNSQRLQAGETVLLKRGETWLEHLDIAASKADEERGPVKFGAYGDGDKPIIGMVRIRRDDTVLEDITVDQQGSGYKIFSLDFSHRVALVDEREVSTAFLEEFARQGITLSPRAQFRRERGAVKWAIRDYDNDFKFGVVVQDDRLDILKMDDAVRIVTASNCVLRRLTLRNGNSDGIDADYADGLLVEDCHIHHFLAGAFDAQEDAHGIVITRTRAPVIRGTEIHQVSGDSLQTDPYRSEPLTSDVLIENCHFWTAPLEADYNDGWRAGQRPGENAIDTKGTDDFANGPRMRLTIRNVRAHGWLPDSFISTKAAFNMKEKIEAEFENVTIFDCELAFRLRGTRGNANVSLSNVTMSNCEGAIRAEDNLNNLKVIGCKFGPNIERFFIDAAMDRNNPAKDTWQLRDNLFARVPDPGRDKIELSETAEATSREAGSPTLVLEKSNRLGGSGEFSKSQSDH